MWPAYLESEKRGSRGVGDSAHIGPHVFSRESGIWLEGGGRLGVQKIESWSIGESCSVFRIYTTQKKKKVPSGGDCILRGGGYRGRGKS